MIITKFFMINRGNWIFWDEHTNGLKKNFKKGYLKIKIKTPLKWKLK